MPELPVARRRGSAAPPRAGARCSERRAPSAGGSARPGRPAGRPRAAMLLASAPPPVRRERRVYASSRRRRARAPSERGKEDVMESLGKAAVAEFIATFALIFIGAGAVITSSAGDLDLVGVALAHGLVLAIMVSITGHISGGLVNPAVTIALWVGRQDRHAARRGPDRRADARRRGRAPCSSGTCVGGGLLRRRRRRRAGARAGGRGRQRHRHRGDPDVLPRLRRVRDGRGRPGALEQDGGVHDRPRDRVRHPGVRAATRAPR